jgi:hypothetical protein
MATDPLPKLRKICLAMPEATERLSHGEPTWFVRDKKVFVSYSNNHHSDGIVGFTCAAPEGAQDVLVHAEPERFYVPRYVGYRGWLGVRLDVPTDWGRIEEIVQDAYRCVAPKMLAAMLDSGGRGRRP